LPAPHLSLQRSSKRTQQGICLGPSAMLIGVIDDDARMLESIGEWLAATGYEAHLFETAEAFLRDEARESVACIIADVGLPGISGIDLISLLKARGRIVPVILITGRDTSKIEKACRAAGAFALRAKPFDPSEMIGLLRQATSQQRL
jgi:FixJ family two-component response regulator